MSRGDSDSDAIKNRCCAGMNHIQTMRWNKRGCTRQRLDPPTACALDDHHRQDKIKVGTIEIRKEVKPCGKDENLDNIRSVSDRVLEHLDNGLLITETMTVVLLASFPNKVTHKLGNVTNVDGCGAVGNQLCDGKVS
jgi:hypothetical protein